MRTQCVSQWPLFLLGQQNGGEISKCHYHCTLGVSIGTCLTEKTGLQSMAASYLQMILMCVNCDTEWWGLHV